jgi:hypothetical protein
MSSPIMPTRGPVGPSATTAPPGADVDDIGALVAGLSAGEGTLVLQASRGGPPAEVLEQIASAERIERRLRERGRRLRFHAAEPGGRARIELHDLEGDTLTELSAAEALEIVAGKPLG